MRRVLATITLIGVVAAIGALVAPTALAAPRLALRVDCAGAR